jgi:hypothetical protein
MAICDVMASLPPGRPCVPAHRGPCFCELSFMPKLPFMQFYPSDWLVDTQILTPLAKAAWIDIICQLWISPTPGTLRWNRGAFTTYLRLDYDEHIDQVVAELSRVAVLELLDSDNNEVEKFEDCTWIEISSRRILRDVERLNKRKDTHKKYNKTRDKIDSKTTV